jgi:hypothetical protein
MRRVPPLDDLLRKHVDAAVAIAHAGEVVRQALTPGSKELRELHIPRLELLYELAYLRVFIEWEIFLEEVFKRLLCGYTTKSGAASLAIGRKYASSLASAEVEMLRGQNFILWHDPVKVAARAAFFFRTSSLQSVVGSNTARLTSFAAIRHRIVHGQADARRKFDVASMLIGIRRYRGSRAGLFLRDWDTTVTPQRRFLQSIAAELCSLASQIV